MHNRYQLTPECLTYKRALLNTSKEHVLNLLWNHLNSWGSIFEVC